MEKMKDLAVGIVATLSVVALTYGFFFVAEMVGGSKDFARYAAYVVLGLVFAYNFGGLTRSVFFGEGGYFYKKD